MQLKTQNSSCLSVDVSVQKYSTERTTNAIFS